MKKTLTCLLLCVLTLTMILCGCDGISNKEEGDNIIKKVEVREDQDKLTVVYEDGYELSYFFVQPIEEFVEKDGTRSARAIGSTFSQFSFVTSSTGASTITPNGGITFVTGEYNVAVGTGDYVYSTGDVIFSTGTPANDVTYVAYQVQSNVLPRYIEHEGKKYEDCSDELLRKFRASTTLIDFATGYEEKPFDNIYAGGFTKFENLQAIILPASVKKVEEKAFDGCPKLTTVYFCGTEEDWSNVQMVETEVKDKDSKEEKIEIIPNHLTTCTVYFYSEIAPTDAGNYWHYVDGKPTKW